MSERFAAAKEAGFDGVEFLDPYTLNVQQVVSELGVLGLRVVLINCPPPNYTGGAPGWAAVPGSRFGSDLRRGLRYAAALNAENIHIMAGEAEGPAARATFFENLRHAADTRPKQQFTIEPLNQTDRPGYFLSDYLEAADMIRELGLPNVGLQFDTYHASAIHGDVVKVWQDVKDVVRHVQVGQTPDRTAPHDLSAYFDELASSGYSGWVSAEYQPGGDTLASLSWMARLSA